jgi:vancomycin resistance protein YoaR
VIIVRYAPQTGRQYTWKYHASQLGLSVDVNATVAKAMAVGRDDAIGRVTQMVGSSREEHAVAPIPIVNTSVLTAELKKIAHAVNHPPTNCRLTITEGGDFRVMPGKPGSAIDLDASAAAITKLWDEMLSADGSKQTASSADTTAPGTDSTQNKAAASDNSATGKHQSTQDAVSLGKVDLVLAEVQPQISPADIANIDGALGEMNTRIRGTPQRVRNVTIATSHINGTLLASGATFSYNDVVGKRSEEGGYEKAIIFVKGKHVEDIGGGICQTASTLYNAVLRSGLRVVRRQPHCTPVVYVPYGLDATVAYGVVDFQFRNDTDYPVYIYAKAKGRSLTFRIYGKKDPNRKVVLEKLKESSVPTSTEVVQDRSLRPGRRVVKDKGARGYSIVWRRTITENGKTVRSETISSHYRPLPSIIAVGPGITLKGRSIGQPVIPVPAQPPGAVNGAEPPG